MAPKIDVEVAVRSASPAASARHMCAAGSASWRSAIPGMFSWNTAKFRIEQNAVDVWGMVFASIFKYVPLVVFINVNFVK